MNLHTSIISQQPRKIGNSKVDIKSRDTNSSRNISNTQQGGQAKAGMSTAEGT
jgi:hypothetical protein